MARSALVLLRTNGVRCTLVSNIVGCCIDCLHQRSDITVVANVDIVVWVAAQVLDAFQIDKLACLDQSCCARNAAEVDRVFRDNAVSFQT